MQLNPAVTLLRTQRGASLIEVLVSILIVSVGVISMAGMMFKSTQVAKASESRAIAALLAADIADRIKANAVAARAGGFDVTAAFNTAVATQAASACTDAAPCTNAAMAADELGQWRSLVKNSLPEGAGYLQHDTANAPSEYVDVWVAWQDAKALSMGGVDDEFKDLDVAACPAAFTVSPPYPRCVYLRVYL